MIVEQQVAAMSAMVVQCLAASNLPPLSGGRILLGAQELAEHNAPPRIVFVPKRHRYEIPKATGVPFIGPFTTPAAGAPAALSAASDARLQARPLWLKAITYGVTCWGQAVPGAPGDQATGQPTDIAYTEALEEAVILTGYFLAGSQLFKITKPSEWDDTGLAQAGRMLTFEIEIVGALPDVATNVIGIVRPDAKLSGTLSVNGVS
jgi:hypothetical protein